MDTAQITETLADVEGQSVIDLKPTAAIRLCRACSAATLDYDKFCRHCGARQTVEISPQRANAAPMAYVTSRLQADTFSSVSASLLNAIAAGAQAGTAKLNSRCARRAVSVLILLPLWLMIVLLSPFDAYATAKAIAGQHQTSYRNFEGLPGDQRSRPWVL